VRGNCRIETKRGGLKAAAWAAAREEVEDAPQWGPGPRCGRRGGRAPPWWRRWRKAWL
jgi:hypothetical protein